MNSLLAQSGPMDEDQEVTDANGKQVKIPPGTVSNALKKGKKALEVVLGELDKAEKDGRMAPNEVE